MSVSGSGHISFGSIANGAIKMYFDTCATLYLVKQAIVSIELKESRRGRTRGQVS